MRRRAAYTARAGAVPAASCTATLARRTSRSATWHSSFTEFHGDPKDAKAARWCCFPAARIPPRALPGRSNATERSRRSASITASGTRRTGMPRRVSRSRDARHFRAWADRLGEDHMIDLSRARRDQRYRDDARNRDPRDGERFAEHVRAGPQPDVHDDRRGNRVSARIAGAGRRHVRDGLFGLSRLPRRHDEGAASRAEPRHGHALPARNAADVARQGATRGASRKSWAATNWSNWCASRRTPAMSASAPSCMTGVSAAANARRAAAQARLRGVSGGREGQTEPVRSIFRNTAEQHDLRGQGNLLHVAGRGRECRALRPCSAASPAAICGRAARKIVPRRSASSATPISSAPMARTAASTARLTSWCR